MDKLSKGARAWCFFPAVPIYVAEAASGDNILLRIVAAILLCFKMLGGAFARLCLGWLDIVGAGKRLAIAFPHGKIAVVAEAGLGNEGGSTETD